MAKMDSGLILIQCTVDGTLSILCNAAQSRGLSHKLTRNLALLAGTHLNIYHDVAAVHSYWTPDRPHDSPEYTVPAPGSRRYLRQKDRESLRPIADEALDAFGEIVRMAEGNSNVSLGRVIPGIRAVVRR